MSELEDKLNSLLSDPAGMAQVQKVVTKEPTLPSSGAGVARWRKVWAAMENSAAKAMPRAIQTMSTP